MPCDSSFFLPTSQGPLLLTSYFPKTIPSTVNDNSPAAELAQLDNAESGALIRCAASLAFAGVLPFAPIITGFAAALAFALVLPFTSMHGLFSCQSLQGNPGMGASRARSVCANRKRTRHKAGDCCPCNDCFGWFNHLSILSSLSLVSGRLRYSTAVLRRQSNIRSLNCARVGILIDAKATPLFPEKKLLCRRRVPLVRKNHPLGLLSAISPTRLGQIVSKARKLIERRSSSGTERWRG